MNQQLHIAHGRYRTRPFVWNGIIGHVCAPIGTITIVQVIDRHQKERKITISKYIIDTLAIDVRILQKVKGKRRRRGNCSNIGSSIYERYDEDIPWLIGGRRITVCAHRAMTQCECYVKRLNQTELMLYRFRFCRPPNGHSNTKSI